jgi:hypothetical protein
MKTSVFFFFFLVLMTKIYGHFYLFISLMGDIVNVLVGFFFFFFFFFCGGRGDDAA